MALEEKLLGAQGRSCPCPAQSLLGLVPSSASVMRWHSSPSRDALGVSLCLREKKKLNNKKKEAAMPGKRCRGILAKVALGMSGQGGCEGSAGYRVVEAGVDYLKGVPC